ncbi:MAG: histidine phosphatase family protein [Simkaniaceae bacterium]|nr:histidine phosphatase family protein [Simkaniaceae bacterium]
MQIYLIRHGHYETEQLSKKGIEEIEKVGHFLKTEGVHPDMITSSPKMRAIETAEILAKALNHPLDRLNTQEVFSPNSPPEEAIELLSSLAVLDALIVCGHLPSIELIANMLQPEPVNSFATGTTCLVTTQDPSTPSGELMWQKDPQAL